MNHRTDEDENRGHESWLSSLARVYGPWHLGITAIQGAAWTAFVYWNESGKRDAGRTRFRLWEKRRGSR